MRLEDLQDQDERERALDRFLEGDAERRLARFAGAHPAGDGAIGGYARAALRAWALHEACKATYPARGLA